MKRLLRLMSASVAVLAFTGIAPAAQAAGPGDEQLVNFAHVFNYKPSSSTIDATARGTDIEFYTSEVPKRDYTTGTLLGADGLPLQPGQPPVIESRDFAVMGSYGGGAWVFDITNPEAPKFVKNIICNQTQNDVQIKKLGDRWILALARDGSTNPCTLSPYKGHGSSSGGLAMFDITDPYLAVKKYSFRVPSGAHNFTFHPTKPFGWVSVGDIVSFSGLSYRQTIPIIDFTNFDAPVWKEITLTGSPHDISFTPDGNRAFVASEHNGQIYDTTDPWTPVLIGMTPNGGTYWHGFDPTPNGKIALATNESLALGGFLVGGSTVCPGEGITFYNVEGSQAQAPVPVGHFLASVYGKAPDSRACTGHVGEVAENSRIYVTGWYIGGARLIDLSNPSLPTEVGIAQMADAEVWAAKFHKGPYVYSADMRRGFDVFKWTGAGTAPWLTP